LPNCGEIDVIFLDDAGVERIEVHDKNEFVPQSTFRFEDETTLIFILLSLCSRRIRVSILLFDYRCCFLAVLLIWDDIFETVKFV